MKKILAIILSIAMLFSVLAINTFAETNPTVTLITNAGSPVTEGDETHLTVRFDNFSTIKGMDVTITANGATLGEVTATGFTGFETLVENENFTKVNDDVNNIHTIRIVDLTGGVTTGKIVFDVTAPAADAIITVEGKYADSGKTLFNITTEAGNLEVKKEIASIPVVVPDGIDANEDGLYELPVSNFIEDTTKKFVPYGSVYKEESNKIVFAKKDTNGNFIADASYSVKSFDIPENGITTFGVSENTADSNVIRFGNYSQYDYDTAPDFHGTMVFEGNWLALKNYYIQKGYTVQELIKAIYNNYDTVINNGSGAAYVYYKVPKADNPEEYETINVYKFKQKNYMWQGANGEKTVLEYALRLTGVVPNKTYTAVAYSETTDGVATISANVKSEKIPTATVAE